MLSTMSVYQEETSKLIAVANNSARISLHGSLTEKKAQLLKGLSSVDARYKNRKKEC